MRITADTNVLLRLILNDDPAQAVEARAILERAGLIAVPIPVFCELAWTMRRGYRRHPDQIAQAIEALLDVTILVTDRPAVEAGLAVLRAGGDFADGVIAWQGTVLGGEALATFDREAARLLNAGGFPADEPGRLLSGS